MQNINFDRANIAVLQRLLLVAAMFPAVMLSGCAQSGGTSNQSGTSSNPAMYTYRPGSRSFETRWPFGPANYH